jgi:hypothetical protein
MIAGALIFPEVYPLLSTTVMSWYDLGPVTLPQMTGPARMGDDRHLGRARTRPVQATGRGPEVMVNLWHGLDRTGGLPLFR